MVDVANLVIQVDTRDLAKAEGALEALELQGLKTERATTALGGATRQAGGAAKNFQFAVQNASYQVGDFAVQVASGTAASRAMAQQLPQLLQGFGLWGAAIGALVAVGAALAPVLFNMAQEAKSFDDAMDDLAETTDRLNRSMRVLKLDTDQLIQQYGEAADRVRAFAIAQAELEAAQAGRRLADALALATEELREYTMTASSAFRSGTTLSTAIGNLARDLDISRDAARGFESILREIRNADSFDVQSAALERLVAFMRDNNIEAEKLPPELARAVTEMLTLAGETERAAQLMAQLSAEAAGVTIGVPLDPNRTDLLPPARPGETPRRGGGGRSAADSFAADLERLQKSLMTERELVDQWYQESQTLLADKRAQELLDKMTHDEAMLRLEEEYQRRLQGIRGMSNNAGLGAANAFFGAMAGLMSSGNERLFKIGKTAAIASALINTYEGITQALAKYPPPLSYAYAAATAAQGFAQVAAIRSQSFGGGGTTGAVSSAGAVQSTETSPRVALQLVGSEGATFSQTQVRDLINQINEAVEGGAIIRLV